MKTIKKINTFLNVGLCPLHQQYIEFVCQEAKCKDNKFVCGGCEGAHLAHHQITTTQYAKRISSLAKGNLDGQIKLYWNMATKNKQEFQTLIGELKSFLYEFQIGGEWLSLVDKNENQIYQAITNEDIDYQQLQQLQKNLKIKPNLPYLKQLNIQLEKCVKSTKKTISSLIATLMDINDKFVVCQPQKKEENDEKSMILIQQLMEKDMKQVKSQLAKISTVFNVNGQDLINSEIESRFREILGSKTQIDEIHIRDNALNNQGLHSILEEGKQQLKSLKILDLSGNSLEEDISLQIIMIFDLKTLEQLRCSKESLEEFKAFHPKVKIDYRQ